MSEQRNSMEAIEDFLGQKRIAMIGVSRDPADFSAQLFVEFCRRGYDMVPVNPTADKIMGRHCYANVGEVTPPVDGALVMTTPEVTNLIVRDCAAAGVKRVWMYRGGGDGAVSPEATAYCDEQGIKVVEGECPYMFFPMTGGFHRFHGFLRKVFGHYPQRASA